MSSAPKYVLAIESAISGGSISLLRDGEEIADSIGNSGLSRAEDLLSEISTLLTAHSLTPQDLNLVVVSAGPGSFTGIRIGIATGLGLKNGLNVELRIVSALEAMASVTAATGPIICAVPIGRNAVGSQCFLSPLDADAIDSEPVTSPQDEFLRSTDADPETVYVLHSDIAQHAPGKRNVIDFGANIAFAVGKYAASYPERITEPLFLSKGF